MNKWKRRGAAVLAALLLVMPLAISEVRAVSEPEEEGSAAAKAQEMAEVLIGSYGVNGVQYAIRDEGEIVLSGGLAVTESGSKRPVAREEMFGIGSVSKVYVTAATLMLAEAGKIDIDRPLTAYIPEFEMADPRYKQITPRMLMNHSAGLYGSHYKNSMLFDDNDTENHDTLLDNLRHQRLKSDPGEYGVYANDGFQLLEILVERVSGMSYSEFLARYVSEPLQLRSTKTPLDDFDRGQLHPVRFPGIAGALPPENANVIGTGGIYSTAEEVTLFSEVLTGHRTEVLSKASALAMQNPEYRNGIWVEDEENVFGYGLGWDSVDLAPFEQYGLKAMTKGGDTIMYHSALIALPEEGISVALLTSGGSSLLNTAAATSIMLTYLKETGEIGDIYPDKVPVTPVQKDMPGSLNAYSGLYGTVGSTLDIAVEDGQIKLPGLMDGLIPEQTYVYTGGSQFTGEDGLTVISFDDQSNGHTYVRVKSVLEFPGLGQSPMAYYEYQRLDANPLTELVAGAWSKRDQQTYYAVDEKINSLFYLMPSILMKTIALDEQGGYANGAKITGEDQAVNVAEIPVMNGRDVFDLTFFRKNGMEYLQADGRTYVSEAAVRPIYAGVSSTATIPDAERVRWYKVGDSAAGRTMTVDLPQQGGFAVYDADGVPVRLSVADGGGEVVLPEDGLIVFGGEAGDVFNITLKQQK